MTLQICFEVFVTPVSFLSREIRYEQNWPQFSDSFYTYFSLKQMRFQLYNFYFKKVQKTHNFNEHAPQAVYQFQLRVTLLQHGR